MRICCKALYLGIGGRTGPLGEKARLLVTILEMIPLTRQLPCARGWLGRPERDRQALATTFEAKSAYGLETTRQLWERLRSDRQLRCLCSWTSPRQIPRESTFSRAFQEFAESELPQRLHEAVILHTQKDRLVGYIARDSTAIEARERFEGQAKHRSIPKRKRGRPRKSERALSGRRLPRQRRHSRLKDEFGARHIRMRGASKIMAHLMFGLHRRSTAQTNRIKVPSLSRANGAGKRHSELRRAFFFGHDVLCLAKFIRGPSPRLPTRPRRFPSRVFASR